MLLDNLTLSNFRNIESVDISFSPGINFLVGENGAGKTSVLEALNLYWNGKSFRSNTLNKLIKEDTNEAVLSGHISQLQGERSVKKVFGLSVGSSAKGKVVKFDGERVFKSSFLARLLPVFYYSPANVSLVSGSPSERRKLLNWFMFHVEPAFNDHFQKLKTAVNNRNKLLKISHGVSLENNPEFDFWEKRLSYYSEELIKLVNAHIEGLSKHFRDFLQSNEFDHRYKTRCFKSLDIAINKGWNDEQNSLQSQLLERRTSDAKSGVSKIGFHRSDICLINDGSSKVNNLSRGEEKSLGLLLILSMLALMKSYNKPVLLLLDDLRSELDFNNAKFIISTIAGLGFQTIVTSIDKSFIVSSNEKYNYKLFHVKQGNICEDN